jgi:hypothetical protein
MGFDTTTDPNRPTIDKDPDAILTYSWDWTAWLDGDTIASYVVTSQTGLTIDSDNQVAGVVSAVVSGGNPGRLMWATCSIVTVLGQTDERTMYFNVIKR